MCEDRKEKGGYVFGCGGTCWLWFVLAVRDTTENMHTLKTILQNPGGQMIFFY